MALDWRQVPAFYASLEAQEGIAADALRSAILTAARTGEVLAASWPEIDLDQAVWTIPAARMKAGRDHRVALSSHGVELLLRAQSMRAGDAGFVFRGQKKDAGLSNMACLAVLKRMERSDIITYGFRSSFKDWGTKATSFASEAVKLALAHAINNELEAACRRGDLLQRRFELAQAWGDFVTGAKLSERRSLPDGTK